MRSLEKGSSSTQRSEIFGCEELDAGMQDLETEFRTFNNLQEFVFCQGGNLIFIKHAWIMAGHSGSGCFLAVIHKKWESNDVLSLLR